MDALRAAFPRTRWLLAAGGVVISVFLIAPIAAILPLAFTTDRYLIFPPSGFSWKWFQQLFSDPTWRASILNSLNTALIGAAIATVAGACAALALRRMRRGRAVVRTVMLAPMVMPLLILTLGLYFTYRAIFGSTSLAVMVLGQATLAAPLVFVNVAAGLASVDPNLTRAAESLGFRWYSVVRRIELPLISRSIVSGAILAFAVCFDDAVFSFFLAPPGALTLPVKLWRSAAESVSPTVAAASALIIAIALTLLAIVAVLQSRPKGEPR